MIKESCCSSFCLSKYFTFVKYYLKVKIKLDTFFESTISKEIEIDIESKVKKSVLKSFEEKQIFEYNKKIYLNEENEEKNEKIIKIEKNEENEEKKEFISLKIKTRKVVHRGEKFEISFEIKNQTNNEIKEFSLLRFKKIILKTKKNENEEKKKKNENEEKIFLDESSSEKNCFLIYNSKLNLKENESTFFSVNVSLPLKIYFDAVSPHVSIQNLFMIRLIFSSNISFMNNVKNLSFPGKKKKKRLNNKK